MSTKLRVLCIIIYEMYQMDYRNKN